MKTLWIVLCLTLTHSSFATEVKLSEIKDKLLERNLEVQATAEQVYQSRLQIQLARRNLLPRLNISKIISVPFSVGGAIGLIEDIAPFLFPANWFKIKETKYLAQASEFSFDTLKLNQIFMGRSSGLTLLADQAVLADLENQDATLQMWIDVIRLQERLGQLPVGTSADFERLQLEANRDVQLQRQGVLNGLSEMKAMFGMKQSEQLSIGGSFEEISDVPLKIKPKWYEDTPETQSFDYLILAAYQYKRGFFFSFLGFTSNARGLSGGIFDGLPEPQGLSFGIGPTMEIASSQAYKLELQREGAMQTQQKAYAQALAMIESQKGLINNVVQREKMLEDSLELMESRVKIGLPLDANRLFVLLRDRLATRVEHTITRLHSTLAIERKHRIVNQLSYADVK